jgi:hypothetical protein
LELDHLTSRESKSNFTLPKFNDGLTKVEMLLQLHEQARNRFGYDLERYNQLKNAYYAKIPAVLLIENGTVPLVKSRPHRLMLVLISVFVTFIVTVIGILLIDNYRDINWKKDFNAE